MQIEIFFINSQTRSLSAMGSSLDWMALSMTTNSRAGSFRRSAGTAVHIDTVVLRFSPRLGFAPVNRDLTNSNAATALLAGPSHNSAGTGVTGRTQHLGAYGPCEHLVSG